MRRKIYLAARFGLIETIRQYADMLKEDGHTITSSWVYGKEEGLTFPDIALLDVRDVAEADTLIKFTEPYGTLYSGGGRQTEFGIALAKAGTDVFIVGPREQIFDWHPDVIDFPNFDYLRRYIKPRVVNAA